MASGKSLFRPELQSVRGLAALGVLVYHCLIFYKIGPGMSWFAEYVLNPHALVVLFFVMSAIVLTRALGPVKPSIHAYVAFGIRRGARIYPALWFAVVLALVYYLIVRNLLPPAPNRSDWAVNFDDHHLTTRNTIGALMGMRELMVPPLWSIKVELFAAVIVPILAWLALAGPRRPHPVLYGVTLLLGIYSFWANVGGQYLVDFAIGAIAAAKILEFEENRTPRPRSMRWLPILIFLMLFRAISSDWSFEQDYHAPIPALVEAMAAALLLIELETTQLSGSMLLAPALVWLGDISYSVYLLHVPVLEFNSRILAAIAGGYEFSRPNMSAIVLTLATIAVVLPLSHLVYRYVERGGIRLGSRMVHGFDRLAGNWTSALGRIFDREERPL